MKGELRRQMAELRMAEGRIDMVKFIENINIFSALNLFIQNFVRMPFVSLWEGTLSAPLGATLW